jgi:hypothetical protein
MSAVKQLVIRISLIVTDAEQSHSSNLGMLPAGGAMSQNDPEVQKQFLELTRRWLLLGNGLTGLAATPSAIIQTEQRAGG